MYTLCVFMCIWVRERNSNGNGKCGLHSPCIHCNMNRLRGVGAYIDLTTSTVKRKKMLRSILSCFPFEMCELWKLKAITLMFLLVGFFLCCLFAIMCCGNLTSLWHVFFPPFPISRRYAHIWVMTFLQELTAVCANHAYKSIIEAYVL